MRKFLLVLLFVLGFSAVSSAQALDPMSQTLGFDYVASDVTKFGIERFEMRLDSGSWATAVTSTFTDANTVSGSQSYRILNLPAMTPGSHVFAVRACGANNNCSAALSLAFDVQIVIPPVQNLRVLPPEAVADVFPPRPSGE
jgi:hypothetical protein